MRGEEGVYLIDKVENLGKYAFLGSGFTAVGDFAAKHDLTALEVGRRAIDGERVFVNCDEVELVEPAARKAELHHRYFDIHVPLLDEEVIGVARFDPAARGTFDEAKDIGFYEQPVGYVTLRPGQMLIVWPKTGLHAPACTVGARRRAKKLVFKILAD